MPKKDIIITGIVGVVILVAGYLFFHFYQPKIEVGKTTMEEAVMTDEQKAELKKMRETIIGNIEKYVLCKYGEQIVPCSAVVQDILNLKYQQDVSKIQPQVNP